MDDFFDMFRRLFGDPFIPYKPRYTRRVYKDVVVKDDVTWIIYQIPLANATVDVASEGKILGILVQNDTMRFSDTITFLKDLKGEDIKYSFKNGVLEIEVHDNVIQEDNIFSNR